MNKYKVGDRVRVYACGGTPYVGNVTALDSPNNNEAITVSPDHSPKSLHFVHPKQCRKLKKRIEKDPSFEGFAVVDYEKLLDAWEYANLNYHPNHSKTLVDLMAEALGIKNK